LLSLLLAAPAWGQTTPQRPVSGYSQYAPQQQPPAQYAPAAQPNSAQPGRSQYAQPAQYAPPQQPPAQYAPPATQGPSGYAPIRTAQAPLRPVAGPVQAPAETRTMPLFQLAPQEQALLDQVLTIWETESDKIKSFDCPFDRFEYDPVFGPGDQTPSSKSTGNLRYMKPDKGAFRVDEVKHYTAPKEPGGQPTYEPRANDPGEHWVCDGEAVYEFNTPKKQLIVRPLPPEMRGDAIADGPLPFLFGVKKAKLKARYSMKVARTTETDIWLEALPRWPGDAANFRRVELILHRDSFLPKALQVYQPNGKNRTVYMFGAASVNNALAGILNFFQQPRTPLGWKKVVEHPTPAPQGPSQARGQAGERR
jgi:TIGR03009 family protein